MQEDDALEWLSESGMDFSEVISGCSDMNTACICVCTDVKILDFPKHIEFSKQTKNNEKIYAYRRPLTLFRPTDYLVYTNGEWQMQLNNHKL